MTRYLVSTVTLRSPEYYIYSDSPKQDAQIPLLRDLRQRLAVKSKWGERESNPHGGLLQRIFILLRFSPPS